MAFLHYGKNVLRRSSMPHPVLFAAQGVRYRKIKVDPRVEIILTTNVDKLGKAGEVVKVKAGYFRNDLMPKLLAVPNIDRFAYLISEQRKIYQPKEDEEVNDVTKPEDTMKEYETAAKRLSMAKLSIRKFVIEGKGLEVRDPVTKQELVSEVARQLRVQIELENLILPSPLSTLGEHKVQLRLPKAIPNKPAGEGWVLNVKVRKR